MVERLQRLPRTKDGRSVSGWRRGQDDDNATKANKVPTADEDNIIVFGADGDLKDSEVPIDAVSRKVIGGTEGNILTLKADGDMQDSGDSIADIETRLIRRSYFYGRIY